MLELYDVPDLIDALADRFSAYNIGPREARHITIEMLDAAFSEQAWFDENMLDPLTVNDWKH